MSYRAICFVDMPFGKKPSLTSGFEVDFERIYEAAIKPAILEVGLEPARSDREHTRGVVHIPLFGRLLLSDYAVMDMTLANPNIFSDLGVRHALRPFTTVTIYAVIHNIPFDVGLVRSITYNLDKSHLTDEAADALKHAIMARLIEAISRLPTKDSPLFQLIPTFPAIDLTHEFTEIFLV